MQTKENIINECPVDIMGINLRLSFVEAVEEEGAMDVSYTYDMYREWVEVTEGGYVVESGTSTIRGTSKSVESSMKI